MSIESCSLNESLELSNESFVSSNVEQLSFSTKTPISSREAVSSNPPEELGRTIVEMEENNAE